MTENQKRRCWVTDFDGTVSLLDFYEAVAKEVVGIEALKFWDAWIEGKITHLQAIQEILIRIRIPEERLKDLIDRMEIRPGFMEAYDYAVEKGWEIHMASAGCSYYVERVLSRLGVGHIQLVTNKGEYSPSTGLVVTPPVGSRWYSDFYGIDKAKYVRVLQEEGSLVLYSGDGLPDLEALSIADYAFAAGVALERCRQDGIKVEELDTFAPVLARMKLIDQAGE